MLIYIIYILLSGFWGFGILFPLNRMYILIMKALARYIMIHIIVFQFEKLSTVATTSFLPLEVLLRICCLWLLCLTAFSDDERYGVEACLFYISFGVEGEPTQCGVDGCGAYSDNF